jgi:phage terminase large subunit-like protein
VSVATTTTATEWGDIGPYVSQALEYATDVVEGRVPACKWMRLACERQLADLERDGPEFPFYFDVEAASRPCRLIESLPHIEGEWAARGELIKLEPWQLFMITTVYGWRHNDTSRRRFRQAYWEVARKNAKSTIAAGLALNALDNDDEAGAQVYSAATKKDQAKIVFDHAKEMMSRAKAKGARWARRIQSHKNVLFVPKTASKFAPLDREASSQDGLNVHTAINDELHAWKRRDLYAVIETATGARRQPLIINITTAGYNLGGICYELRDYGLKVLQGLLTDETFMVAIWTIDDDDDPWDPACWPKANPNLGISVYADDMRALAAKAQSMPSQQTDFLTKRLNVWCNAEASWMDMTRWNACARPGVRMEEFAGSQCIGAIDVAEKRDITARCLLFQREEKGKRHVYAFLRYYLPEDAARNTRHAGYDGWIRAGLITVTDGNIIDLDTVRRDLVDDSRKYTVAELAFDPHNATAMALELNKTGMRTVEFRQTPMNFDEPMRWWEAMVAEGTFHHNGDPVLTWMVSNVTIRKTGRMHEFLHPRKERDTAKIDGAVTICMALKRLMAEREGYTVYESRGIVVV